VNVVRTLLENKVRRTTPKGKQAAYTLFVQHCRILTMNVGLTVK